MSAMFELRLKTSQCGIPSGTTIRVVSTFLPTEFQISEVLKQRFGAEAAEAAWKGDWEIKRL